MIFASILLFSVIFWSFSLDLIFVSICSIVGIFLPASGSYLSLAMVEGPGEEALAEIHFSGRRCLMFPPMGIFIEI